MDGGASASSNCASFGPKCEVIASGVMLCEGLTGALVLPAEWAWMLLLPAELRAHASLRCFCASGVLSQRVQQAPLSWHAYANR